MAYSWSFWSINQTQNIFVDDHCVEFCHPFPFFLMTDLSMGSIMRQKITPEKMKLFRIPWARLCRTQSISEVRALDNILQGRGTDWIVSDLSLWALGTRVLMGSHVQDPDWDYKDVILRRYNFISRVFNPFETADFVSASWHSSSATCEAALPL